MDESLPVTGNERPEIPLDEQFAADVEKYVSQGFSAEMAKKEAMDDLEMRARSAAEAASVVPTPTVDAPADTKH